MHFIGIDPGKSGGVAVISENGAFAYKMPDTERDIFELIQEVGGLECFATIEKVHAMPKQGAKSTFSFGQNYGMLRAFLIACGIPFDEVSPQKWQKELGCQTKGDKNVTKAKAQQLYPDIKITHAIADALLIAKYTELKYRQ